MGNILSTSFFFLSLAFSVREKLGRSKRSDCRVFVLILVHPYIGHHNKDDIEIEVLTCEDGYNIMLNKKLLLVMLKVSRSLEGFRLWCSALFIAV